MFENLLTNIVAMYFFSLIIMIVAGMVGYKIIGSIAGFIFFQIIAVCILILVFPSIFGVV